MRVELMETIELLRERMMKSAHAKGFTHKVTIKHSQELDRLLTEWQKVRTTSTR
jgi:hypothetical protein